VDSQPHVYNLVTVTGTWNDTFDVFNGTTPLLSQNDARLETLLSCVDWFDEWAAEAGHSGNTETRAFISYQLYFDLRIAVYGFIGFIRHYLGDGTKRPNKSVTPHSVSQDVLENLFALVRTSTSERHPTAAGVRRTIEHIESSSQAVVKSGNSGGGRKRASKMVASEPGVKRQQTAAAAAAKK